MENFNGGADVTINNSAPASGSYSLPGGLTGNADVIDVWMTNHPDNLRSKTYIGQSGWKEGLTLATEDCLTTSTACTDRKRWTWTDWTQDDANLTYIQNPRVIETRVGDGTNTKRTTVQYLNYPLTSIAQFGLVSSASVYDTNLTTELKRVETDYNLATAYTNRRIIGLPSEVRAYGKNDVTQNVEFVSKTTYAYDEENFSQEPNQIIAPTRHDTTNYGSTFITGRGNLTSATRHDVTGQTAAVTSRTRYDIAGSVVAQLDPLNRKVAINYTDNFNSTGNPATFAYPTTITDPANSSSTVKYRYDFGANVRAQSPAPAGQAQGKITEREYDSIGRLLKDKIANYGGAYTRYEYPTNGVQSKVFSTIIDTNSNGADSTDEVLSESWADGAGRVRMSRIEHPGSTGGWSGILTDYDILGRVARQSVPTEVSVSGTTWTPAGDDLTRGWLWTYQKYDWMGRVVRKINTDGIDQTTLNDSDVLISYDGCGCAGGLVTTVEGELVPEPGTSNQRRRKQKSYSDILGRTWKAETYEWNGTTVYSTVVNTFNGRDQVTQSRQYAGTTSSSTYQDTTATFDGHSRLKTSHRPEQNTGVSTTYNYNADDSTSSVTDGRGITTNFIYNNRGLVQEYNFHNGTSQTTGGSFTYDAVGSRTSMTDRLGTVTYEYDSLSRMTSEERDFLDSLPYAPSNGFKISYEYELAGGLKKMTDPYGQEISYTSDKTGRLETVSGSSWANNTAYLNDIGYRAFGEVKSIAYSNSTTQAFDFNNRLQISNFNVKKNGTTTFEQGYQYLKDGNLKFSGDSTNTANIFNRSYTYDFSGRMRSADSGTEASGIPQSDLSQLPYRLFYAYNAFDNVLTASGTNWSGPVIHQESIANGRMSSWNYDADGRMLSPNYLSSPSYSYFTYDLDGQTHQRVSGYNPSSGVGYWHRAISQFRDGDGNLVKQSNFLQTGSVVQTNKSFYFIRSSVLGGKVITEVTQNGSKNRTFVFAGNKTVAVQKGFTESGTWSPSVQWQYSDPSETSFRVLDSSGNTETEPSAELEPSGTEVGFEDPNVQDPLNHIEYGPYASFGSPFSCLLDGVEAPCNMVFQLINNGSAARCPNDSCGPIRRTFVSPTGEIVDTLTFPYRVTGNDDIGTYPLPKRAQTKLLQLWLNWLKDPRALKGASAEEATKFATAIKLVEEKLKIPECLQLLGGLEHITENISSVEFDVGTDNMPVPLGYSSFYEPAGEASTTGETVTINRYGTFFSEPSTTNPTGFSLAVDNRTYFFPDQFIQAGQIVKLGIPAFPHPNNYNLWKQGFRGNVISQYAPSSADAQVEFRAFEILHELGHVFRTLLEPDGATLSILSNDKYLGRQFENNRRVRDACFPNWQK